VLACFLREIARVAIAPLDRDRDEMRRLMVRLHERQARLDLEEKIVVPVSAMILASQLIIAVSDDVPKFNIARGCKVDSTAAFDLNAGLDETIKRCVNDEQQAKDQLQAHWSQFADTDRRM
jgi:hypothetical protein